jgi:anti-anti-sigma factor
MTQLNFGIHEALLGDGVRLTVTGELDFASAPILEQRLEQLRIDGYAVQLDLSRLEFIDSSGLQVLFKAIRSTSRNGWRFEIEPDVAPQTMHVFKLVNLDRFLPGGR